jgi:glyoxylase I family protein
MQPGLLALDHVALPIYDAAASVQFYGEVLELPLLSALTGDDWGGRPWLMMTFGLAGGRQLALCALRGAQRPPPGELPNETHHIGFMVASDAVLGEWKQRLLQLGLHVTEEDHGTQRSLYFEEPNGYVLELTTPPAAASFHDEQASATVAEWVALGSRESGVVPTRPPKA